MKIGDLVRFTGCLPHLTQFYGLVVDISLTDWYNNIEDPMVLVEFFNGRQEWCYVDEMEVISEGR